MPVAVVMPEVCALAMAARVSSVVSSSSALTGCLLSGMRKPPDARRQRGLRGGMGALSARSRRVDLAQLLDRHQVQILGEDLLLAGVVGPLECGPELLGLGDVDAGAVVLAAHQVRGRDGAVAGDGHDGG